MDQMLRVVQYLHTISVEGGGPVFSVCRLTALLNEHSGIASLRLLCSVDRSGTSNFEFGGGALPTMECASVFGLVREVRRSAPNVVHLHGVWIPQNLAVATTCYVLGVPYIVSPRGQLGLDPMQRKAIKKRVFWRLFGSKYLSSASGVHFTSPQELEEAEAWVEGLPGNRYVIANVLPERRSMPTDSGILAYRYNAHRIVFVGRVHPIKRLDLLLEAIGELCRTGHPWTLHIVGPIEDKGHYVRLLELLDTLGIRDQVVFEGVLVGEDLQALVGQSTLCCLVSDHENFGVAAFEAMRLGLPVVVREGFAHSRDIRRCGAGAVAGDTGTSIAKAISGLVSNWQNYVNASRAAEGLARETVDSDSLRSSYMSMYADVMA